MFSRDTFALLEAVAEAIVVVDQRGTLLAVNEFARRLFGYRSDELLGENLNLLMSGTDRRAPAGLLDAYLLSGASRIMGEGCDVVAKNKSGVRFPAVLSVGQIPNSQPPQFVGSVRDTSAQMRREEESLVAQARLTSVARLATLGEMASGIAHELNQPLTAINAYARACEHFIALPQPDLAELRDAVREIGAEALRAGDIIRRVRQLVRSDPVVRVPTDPDALIDELKVLIAADARIHGANVTYQLDSDGCRVVADGVQIQHLILNLVRNAFEALATQPPESRECQIATARSADQLEIRVSDNGPGVSPAVASRLFEPFCTTKPHGTGLGLAISRTIAQSHGGTIGFRPNSPHGACFDVRLPALEYPAA